MLYILFLSLLDFGILNTVNLVYLWVKQNTIRLGEQNKPRAARLWRNYDFDSWCGSSFLAPVETGAPTKNGRTIKEWFTIVMYSMRCVHLHGVGVI